MRKTRTQEPKHYNNLIFFIYQKLEIKQAASTTTLAHKHYTLHG